MKPLRVFLVLLVLAVVAVSCTKQARVKTFGGSMDVEVARGQKVIVATWKESDLWVLTRPMREEPETLTFSESSSFGVWQGQIVFKESK